MKLAFTPRQLLPIVLACAVTSLAWPYSLQAAPPASEGDSPSAPAVETPAPAPTTPAPEAELPKTKALSQEVAEQGEAELQKSVRVFQQRYLLKTHRAELLFGGTSTFNDPYVHHYGADATLLFHLNEQWSIGAGGAKWWGSSTTAFSNIQNNYGLFPEKSVLQAGGWLETQWSPVIGKFTSFGVAVLQADAYLLAGVGVVRTTRGTALKPAGDLGGGVRIHALRWLTLALEVRNLLFMETFETCETGSTGPCGNLLMKHWFGGLKLGLWIPPGVQYKYQR